MLNILFAAVGFLLIILLLTEKIRNFLKISGDSLQSGQG